MQGAEQETAEALRRGDLDAAVDAGLPEAERVLLEFVQIVTERPAETTDANVESLREAGWSDEQVAEAVFVTALFAFFNRVADAFGLEAADYSAILENAKPAWIDEPK